MESFNNYTFRAITKGNAILIFILIIPVFLIIYAGMEKFIFYDIKDYNAFTITKILGIPMILTWFAITLTSNYILGNKYLIEIEDNEITIYRNNKIFHCIELSQIQKIEFYFSLKQSNGYLSFDYNSVKIFMLIGLLFTKKKDFVIVNNYFNAILRPYLLNNNFLENEQKNKQITICTLIKKD